VPIHVSKISHVFSSGGDALRASANFHRKIERPGIRRPLVFSTFDPMDASTSSEQMRLGASRRLTRGGERQQTEAARVLRRLNGPGITATQFPP
jgi:hypothetical protein